MPTLSLRRLPCASASEPLPAQTPPLHTRRRFVGSILAAGSAATFGLPMWTVHAAKASSHADDWCWLVGNWDVWHRRLKERLAGSTEWEEFGGKSALWLTMGGFGTIDDNIVSIPSGTYRGLSLRAFD